MEDMKARLAAFKESVKEHLFEQYAILEDTDILPIGITVLTHNYDLARSTTVGFTTALQSSERLLVLVRDLLIAAVHMANDMPEENHELTAALLAACRAHPELKDMTQMLVRDYVDCTGAGSENAHG